MISGIPEKVDVAIIGAGPAGSTLAALLKKYHPKTDVCVFERDHFPRHKVGEGLIVDINRVLADMGCLEELEKRAFPKKYGTTFVWGAERRPSTFLFRDGQALVGSPEGYQLEYTWHVDRPTYDQILAECAMSYGAQVAFGHRVDALIEEGERVTGVEVVDEHGSRTSVKAKWVIDCAGGSGPLTRQRGKRRLDDELRNIALFAYHRNLGWRDDLQGPPELRRTLIMTHPRGWVWLIPISREETSVGFVTRLSTFMEEKARRGGKLDPEAYYFEVLRDLPEYEDLFPNSEVIHYRDSERLVHTVQEFSYSCEHLWGEGWATCGDSSGFVDAILSIGCFVAQSHAQFLAYALGSVLSGECTDEVAMGSYETIVQENLEAFRAVTHMFYAFNSSRSDWWKDCSMLLRESAYVPDGADKASFLAFVNGFTARHGLYEEAVNAFGNMFLVGIGESLFPDEGLFDEEACGASMRTAADIVASDPILEVTCGYEAQEFALPRIGTGGLSPVTRLFFDRETAVGQQIARRLVAPAGVEVVLSLLDGQRRLSEVIALLEERSPGPPPWDERVQSFALRLLRAGIAKPAQDERRVAV